MPLINCKTHLDLSWTKNCVMYGNNIYDTTDNNNNNNNNSNNNETTSQITNAKL